LSEAKLALKGSLILICTKISEKLLGLVSTLVLARILLPEDFGIIAISLLVISFMDTIANSGGREYIIRKDTVNDADINTFWTLNICLKAGIFMLIILVTPFIAGYYEDERLLSLLPTLSLILLTGSLTNPALVICQRTQNYIPLLKIDVAKKVMAITFSISAALYFQNYWALIVGHLTSNITGFIYSYIMFSYRPKLSLKKLREQWAFSQWMLARSVLGYSRSQLDTFFVSTFFSASALGGFHISKYISNMPGSEVLAPALVPLLASYSKTKHVIDDFKHQITLTIIVVAATAFPIAAFVFYNSFEIVSFILGKNWLEYSSLFAFLSLLVVPHTIGKVAGSIITSTGKVNLLFYYDLLSLLTMIGILYSLRNSTLEWLTLGKLATELVMVFCLLTIGILTMFRSSIISLYAILIASCTTAFGLGYLLNTFSFGLPVFFELALNLVIFFVSWIAIVILFFKVFLRRNHAALHIKYLLGNGFKGLLSNVKRASMPKEEK
jgi:O-antigen/teichoic acid export membrane protein